MKAADDINNPFYPADFPGIFGDIADSCMRASRYNDQSVIGTRGKRGIIPELVRFDPAIGQDNPPRSRIALFEREFPGNLPKEYQIIGDPYRLFRQVH